VSFLLAAADDSAVLIHQLSCEGMYDPGKKRAEDLKNLAKEAGADGVIWVGTKFCDPEEFDYVPVKNVLDEAGIPVLTIEVDRQMVNFEQIRTAAEAFKDAVG